MSWIDTATTELLATESGGQRRTLAKAVRMPDGAWRLDATPGLGLPDRLWEGKRPLLPILVGTTSTTRLNETSVRRLLTLLAEAIGTYLAAQVAANASLGMELETLPSRAGQGSLLEQVTE